MYYDDISNVSVTAWIGAAREPNRTNHQKMRDHFVSSQTQETFYGCLRSAPSFEIGGGESPTDQGPCEERYRSTDRARMTYRPTQMQQNLESGTRKTQQSRTIESLFL